MRDPRERQVRAVLQNGPRRAALVLVLLAVSACARRAEPGPFIAAVVGSFPPGSAPAAAGSDAGASVQVLDPNTGEPIATASVTVNGVTLPFDATAREYVGAVTVAPGETVMLGVAIDGRSYRASVAQFSAYPDVDPSTTSDPWAADAAHVVAWSPGAPTPDAVYVVMVIDAVSGDLVWPPSAAEVVPAGTTSYTIPSDALTVGDRLILAGLTREVPIPGASAGSGLIVAGFGSAPVHVMDDSGRSWALAATTGIPTAGVTDLRRVVWTGTQLVAVGSVMGGSSQCGFIATSPDGRSWTPQIDCTHPTTPVVDGITWSGAQLVAVGGSEILTSPDAVTWTGRSVGAGTQLSDVACSGTACVAVGSGGVVLSSTDEVTWTPQTTGTIFDLWSVAWTGKRFVAGGWNGTVITSDDGTTWSTASSGTIQRLPGIASSPTATVAVGPNGTILVSPDDGSSWSSVGSGTDSLEAVAWSGRRFVAVGEYAVAVSPDGTSWTTPSNFVMGTGVTWTGTRWVAVGFGGSVFLSPP